MANSINQHALTLRVVIKSIVRKPSGESPVIAAKPEGSRPSATNKQSKVSAIASYVTLASKRPLSKRLSCSLCKRLFCAST